MSQETKSGGIEKLLTIIAVMTTFYYLLTFAVEVGFFWTVGLQFMPAFSISDHVSHAAAWVIGTLGAAFFTIAAMLMFMGALAVPSLLFRAAAGWEHKSRQSASLALAPDKWRRLGALCMTFAGLFLFVALIVVNTDVRPSSGFLMAFVVAGFIGLGEFVAGIKLGIWVVPAALAALLSPFALGDWLFISAYGTPILRGEYFVISGKKHAGRPIFAGADKSLYRTTAGLYLVTNDGGTMVHIIPDVPPHWQLPSKSPCKRRPRNDPGPRSVFCDPDIPPPP